MQQKNRSHVHALNSSAGKQKYSFGKDARFHLKQPNTDVSYLPSFERDRRSALIGYGERSLGMIHKEKDSKEIPHSYDIPSMIQVKKGNAFHGGRYDIGSYLMQKSALINPSPNNYTVPSTLDKRGVSLKSRLPDFSLKQVEKVKMQTIQVPGPGAYSVPSSMKVEDKSIMDSKFSNPGSIKIHHSLDISRRKEPVTFQPGPGQCKLFNYEDDLQKYGIGNPENPYGRNEMTRFSKAYRPPVGIKGAQKLPGPGAYKIYSEFDD